MGQIPAKILEGLISLRVPLLGLAVLSISMLIAGGGAPSREGVPAASAAFTSAYRIGVENSWIRVQNIGDAAASVDVSYYDPEGRLLARDSCPSASCPAIAPGGGWTFFQAQQASLPQGYEGSAVVESDQPIVAVQAKDSVRDGKFAIAADTTSIAAGASKLYLPLVANSAGSLQDWQGRFALQNLSSSVIACVTLTYVSADTDTDVAWDPYKPGTGGNERQAGCPNGGRPIPGGGTLLRDPDTFGVPEGFNGAVRIETHKNAQGVEAEKQLLTAAADAFNLNSSRLASYRAFHEGELSTTVLLPLVDREVGPFNAWSTRFQIQNKDPQRPAQVTVRFEGYNVDAGLAFVATQHTFTVKGTRMCFQAANDATNCLAPGDRLPSSFVGTARITSTEPIAVVVNRGNWYDETWTDYRGFRPEDGSTRVLLPVLNKRFGPTGGKRGWDSWFRILVADGGSANVRIRYVGGGAPYTLPVNREATVFQFAERNLPDNFAGTAILESDRPIMVLANLYIDVFRGDTNYMYNGIALP